jgi:hypothetical protein
MSKENRQLQNGTETVNPEITDHDMLHIFTNIMKKSNGKIPNCLLEPYFKMSLVKTVGRRPQEIYWIAPGSWWYEMRRDEKKNRLIRMTGCESCYKKGTQLCRYDLAFLENQGRGISKNTVVLALLLFQRRGLMKHTALEVYEGKKPFEIDEEVAETTEELSAKLMKALGLVKQVHCRDLTLTHHEARISALDPANWPGAEAENFPRSIYQAVLALDKKEHQEAQISGKQAKIPMWLTFSGNWRLMTNIRHNLGQHQCHGRLR